MSAVNDAVKTMDAAIDEIAALRKERDDWKGRYDTLLTIWEELRAENAQLRALLVELLRVVKAVEENLQNILDKDRK